MTARVRFDEGILTTTILPLAALAVGLFALFLAYRTPERAKPAGRASESITLVCMLLASGYAAWRWAPPAEHTGALLGLALGAVAVWIGGWLPDKSPNELRTAAFLGIGAAAAGALHLLPVKQATAGQSALLVGAMLGVLAALRSPGSLAAGQAAVFASAIALTDALGGIHLSGDLGPSAGCVAAIGLALALLVGFGLAETLEPLRRGKPVLLLVLLAAAGWILGRRLFDSVPAWEIMVGGALPAFALFAWALREDGPPDLVRLGLAFLLIFGLATLAFAMLQGLGIALLLLALLAACGALGRCRVAMVAGALLGLGLYRLFHQAHFEVVRSVDIGQHYAMLGVVLGMIAPLIPGEWARRQPSSGVRVALATFVWGIAFIGLPLIAVVVLGAKGAIGMLLGISVAPLLSARSGARDWGAVATAAGFGALASLGYGWLSPIELERDAKIRVVAIAGAALVVAALFIAWLAPAPEEPA